MLQVIGKKKRQTQSSMFSKGFIWKNFSEERTINILTDLAIVMNDSDVNTHQFDKNELKDRLKAYFC